MVSKNEKPKLIRSILITITALFAGIAGVSMMLVFGATTGVEPFSIALEVMTKNSVDRLNPVSILVENHGPTEMRVVGLSWC